MSLRTRLLVIATIGMALTGCSNLMWPDQPTVGGADPAVLVAGTTWGQSFEARESGLTAVDIYFAPDPVDPTSASASEISLHLRSDPHSTTDIAVAMLPVAAVTQPAFYHFQFAPRSDSQRRGYFLSLSLTGAGSVLVGDAGGDDYNQGAIYRNGQPLDAQMAFRLGYDANLVWRGVLSDGLAWLSWLGLALLLFVMPGWALLAYFWPRVVSIRWAERLGLAIALSLTVYPLLFLWTGLIGLQLGRLYAWLPVLVALAALGAIQWKYRAGWSIAGMGARATVWFHSDRRWPDVAFTGAAGLVFFTRFWGVRSMVLPLWGDSYQHTLITQLLVDHGALFNSWQPYAGLQTFTYHFGFHASAAVFHWLSQLPVPQAVLWSGQILNSLSIVALYPLAVRVGRSPWAGVLAVAAAGLLSPLPMDYSNWGRYTQLAGQAILPGALYLAWAYFEQRVPAWRLLLLGVLAFAGLALTHYRVLIFAVIFVAALLFVHVPHFIHMFKRAILLGVAAVILFLPWFWHVFGGRMAALFALEITTVPRSFAASVELNAPADPLLYPTWLWVLCAGCLAVGLWRRDRSVVLIAVWSALVVLVTNPQWLRLPGEGIISNFTIVVAAYIPASLIVGSALGRLVERSAPRSWPLWAAIILVVSAWGAKQRLTDLNSDRYGLATWADLRAADWIQLNVPQQAGFVVNSFFAYGDTLAVGTDGGWWLPLLAHRATDIPPLNYALERGDRPDYVNWINNLPRAIQQKGVDGAAVLQMMADRGIDYVYIGQKQGRVNYGGPDVLRPDVLLASASFRPIYHEDRVWIFEVVHNP